jgi:DtxR family Mn-dependent transcriptional regulator
MKEAKEVSLAEAGLSPNLEDYLETISLLQSQNRVARAKQIAAALDVSRGSVTGALKSLAERKLINYSPYSYITLTPKGERLANEIIRRHRALRGFFGEILRLDEASADRNACRVEHAMDLEAINRLIKFVAFLKTCPRGGEPWLNAFEKYCDQGIDLARCEGCLEELKADPSPPEPA